VQVYHKKAKNGVKRDTTAHLQAVNFLHFLPKLDRLLFT